MSLVLGIPPVILKMVQEGALERAFHDGLYPALQYRSEALVEEWPANTGQEVFMSRPGLLQPIVKPLAPGNDPTPQTLAYEQWRATLARFAGTIDTHMPTSVVANANQFLRNIHQLGLQAGQSLNRIPRNELFRAYLGGHTATIANALITATQIRVANLNGFTEVVIPGATVRPVPVSPSTPLAVTVLGVANTVVGFVADDPDDPTGPGTLVLGTPLPGAVAARSAVLSANRPDILRAGGGDTVDALGSLDLFSLQDVINATNKLRRHNVQPHEDGYFHAHISPDSNSQVFMDQAFQRLNTALPEHSIYHEGFLGTIGGIMFLMNTESPDTLNTGAQVPTFSNAMSGTDIGAETVNAGGYKVGRILVTGRGALYERWLNEDQYVSEAGITGKVGEFDVVNAGIQILTERIRLILRAPLDRLQDVVASSWSISTSFPVPSDITAGTGPQRYKRALVIEHVLA